MALSLIIIHIGLVYVYYRTRNELLELKASYREEVSRFNVEVDLIKRENTSNLISLTKENQKEIRKALQEISEKNADFKVNMNKILAKFENEAHFRNDNISKILEDISSNDKKYIEKIVDVKFELDNLRKGVVHEFEKVRKHIDGISKRY